MPKKICSQAGCSTLIKFEDRYCAAHVRDNDKAATAKHYDAHKRDKTNNKFYHSAQWKRLRNLQLKAKPLCEICNDPGEIVDHKEEISDGGCATCLDNLQTLCKVCHNTKTAKAVKARSK